jgi:hypothetical protein
MQKPRPQGRGFAVRSEVVVNGTVGGPCHLDTPQKLPAQALAPTDHTVADLGGGWRVISTDLCWQLPNPNDGEQP